MTVRDVTRRSFHRILQFLKTTLSDIKPSHSVAYVRTNSLRGMPLPVCLGASVQGEAWKLGGHAEAACPAARKGVMPLNASMPRAVRGAWHGRGWVRALPGYPVTRPTCPTCVSDTPNGDHQTKLDCPSRCVAFVSLGI